MLHLIQNAFVWAKERREASKQMTIVIVGLDNAGKTTILNDLKGELDPIIVPTVGFSKPLTINHNGYIVTLYDLGGGERFRNVWKDYYFEVHGAIFVVDAADRERIQECQRELFENSGHEQLSGKPILILGNKQDLPAALPESDIATELRLQELTQCSHSVVKCIAKPACNGGKVDPRIAEGLDWLTTAVGKDFKALRERVTADTAEQKAKNAKRAEAQRIRVAKIKEDRRREREAADLTGEKKGEDGVVLCTLCETNPAVRKSALSQWKPACGVCLDRLTAEKSAKEAASKQGGGGRKAIQCTVCQARDATRKSGLCGWKPVCDECVEELTQKARAAAAAAAAGGGDGEEAAAAAAAAPADGGGSAAAAAAGQGEEGKAAATPEGAAAAAAGSEKAGGSAEGEGKTEDIADSGSADGGKAAEAEAEAEAKAEAPAPAPEPEPEPTPAAPSPEAAAAAAAAPHMAVMSNGSGGDGGGGDAAAANSGGGSGNQSPPVPAAAAVDTMPPAAMASPASGGMFLPNSIPSPKKKPRGSGEAGAISLDAPPRSRAGTPDSEWNVTTPSSLQPLMATSGGAAASASSSAPGGGAPLAPLRPMSSGRGSKKALPPLRGSPSPNTKL